jgi:hypothetical protein
MDQALYALFDQRDAAHRAKADLQAAGFASEDIILMENNGQSLDEVSRLLQEQGVPGDEAPVYAQSIEQGSAHLTIRPGQETEATAFEILRRHQAISVKTHNRDRNPDADELSEADGWDDFNTHPNEHSPDESAESVWTDRNGNIG